MRSPLRSRIARLACVPVLALLLLVPQAAPVNAAGSMFALSISQAQDEVCVGQAVSVNLAWAPNSQYGGGDAVVPLAPLAGPSRISLQASRGYFHPDPARTGGAISGVTTVTYIAESEGTEQIFATAWIGGSSDAIAKDSFKVVACEYFYTLSAQLDMTVSTEGLSYTARYTVKSWGTLTPTDPENPRHLEARDKMVKLNATIISWASSDCTLFTWEPARGIGSVDAIADPGAMGIGTLLKLGPPKDLAWDMDLSFACDGQGHTVGGVYPIASEDPWVQAIFPSSTGTQDVVLDMFEIPFQKLVGSEGITISYTAKLTLEKKESQ